MSADRKFFVGGNFKMNGSLDSITSIISALNDAKFDDSTGETMHRPTNRAQPLPSPSSFVTSLTHLEIVVAPPALYLLSVQQRLLAPVVVSAQNCFSESSGAFTGEISPSQLKDASVHWVILGHSERRLMFGDTEKLVAEKVKAAIAAGVNVIACVGESLEEREKGVTKETVERQLKAIAGQIDEKAWKNIVVAYEPVWAIGTGKVATVSQAQEVHADLRKWLSGSISPQVAEATRIIYGGSVNGKNCAELATAADIDGFLVGGASLKPEFIDICKVNSK